MFVARATLAVASAAALLQVAPLPTTVRLVGRGGRLPWGVPPPERVVALTDRLLAVERGPLRANCVLRSLVLLRYVRPARGTLVVRFGVRPGVRPVQGHAWLERDGEPVYERTDPRAEYQVTWSWPS
jgi:hypothetical protein